MAFEALLSDGSTRELLPGGGALALTVRAPLGQSSTLSTLPSKIVYSLHMSLLDGRDGSLTAGKRRVAKKQKRPGTGGRY